MASGMSLLVIVVEKVGNLDVFAALEAVGVTAFTRLEGTGSGVWQKLDRWVDPDKVVFLSVIPDEKVPEALAALDSRARLSEPGRGIAFSVPVQMGIGVGLPAS